MGKRMTEAARLYWKDIGVLEEARSELMEFLDAARSHFETSLANFWKDAPNEDTNSFVFSAYTSSTVGRIHHFPEASAGIYVRVRYPEYNMERSDAFEVCLEFNQGCQNALAKRVKNYREVISQVSLQHIGRELDWNDPRNVVVVRSVINPEDSEVTGEHLAECTFKALMFLVEIERELSRIDAIEQYTTGVPD